MELPAGTATLPEILRDQGYATLMVGKWHLAKDSDISAAGPQHSWPCQRGFDRFYGFLDAFTNLHQPHRLTEDNHQVEIDQYPDDYYLTDDLTDHAISMMRERKASNPEQPFFLYFAHGAVHAPLLARAEDMERYRGALRDGLGRAAPPPLRAPARARGAAAGHPAARRATPSATTTWCRGTTSPTASGSCSPVTWRSTRRWSTASTRARVDCSPRSTSSGERDNTIVIFTSDNGASREGESVGTTSYYVHLLAGRRRRRRPRPPRPDRRSPDHAALPAGLGHGLEHAVAPLQDQHPRRWALDPVHRVVARALRRRRGRRCVPPPVRPPHRRPADRLRPDRHRSGARARRRGAAPAGRRQLRPDLHRPGRAPARTASRSRRSTATAGTTRTDGRS